MGYFTYFSHYILETLYAFLMLRVQGTSRGRAPCPGLKSLVQPRAVVLDSMTVAGQNMSVQPGVGGVQASLATGPLPRSWRRGCRENSPSPTRTSRKGHGRARLGFIYDTVIGRTWMAGSRWPSPAPAKTAQDSILDRHQPVTG